MSGETGETGDGWAVSGALVPAGLFIGMGIGWAFDYLVQGLFIGLGAGFLAMALARLVVGRESAARRETGPEQERRVA